MVSVEELLKNPEGQALYCGWVLSLNVDTVKRVFLIIVTYISTT